MARLRVVARLPRPPPRRGRPAVYPDRLVLQGLLIMIVRRLETVLLRVAVLQAPTAERAQVHALLANLAVAHPLSFPYGMVYQSPHETMGKRDTLVGLRAIAYASDLRDDHWAHLAPLLPPGPMPGQAGRPRIVDRRERGNAIREGPRTGGQGAARPRSLLAQGLNQSQGEIRRLHATNDVVPTLAFV